MADIDPVKSASRKFAGEDLFNGVDFKVILFNNNL